MHRSVFVLIAASIAVGAACSSFDSSAPTVVGSDAGDAGDVVEAGETCDAAIATDPQNCGTCGHACAANEACSAGQCAPGCADATIFVAASGGDDVNSGCDHKAPKRTIRSALDFAKTLGVKNHEIHVCSDTYAEDGLVLDYPITLRGGYECATFARAPAFGWGGFDKTTGHGKLDPTNLTTIKATNGTTALEVHDASITSAITIEGFTLRGSANGGSGLWIHNGASPLVTMNHIVGATAGILGGSIFGSAGVWINTQAAPELTRNIIEGGGGGSATYTGDGSEGVVIQAAANATQAATPRIHENEIDSGSGMSSSFSSIGIDLSPSITMTGPDALANNAVFFSGTIASNFFPAVGIWVRGSAADVLGNAFYGSSSACTGTTTCTAIGVNITGSSTNVVGNRIAMIGDTTSSASTGPNLYLVNVQSPTAAPVKDVLIANNLLELLPGGKAASAPFVLIASGADSIHVEGNTMIGYASKIADGVQTSGTHVRIDDNLIVGLRYGINSSSAVCLVNNIPENPPAAIANNVFASLTAIATLSSSTGATSPCGSTKTYSRVNPFESDITTADANLVLSGDCVAGEANCVLCTTANCFGELFADTPTPTALISGNPKLAPGVSCRVSQGGAVSSVTTDIANAARTSPVSVGAVEYDGSCTTP